VHRTGATSLRSGSTTSTAGKLEDRFDHSDRLLILIIYLFWNWCLLSTETCLQDMGYCYKGVLR
jgi:hypothetical protein